LPVAALVVGLGLGVAVGVGASVSDPTESAEYRAVQADLREMQADLDFARQEAAEAKASLALYHVREQELVDRSTALDQREQALATREQAVSAVEAQMAARSVTEGTWTVGVDIEPGTYRTEQAVGSDCYWAILRTGSNGDIVDNDIPGGGFPSVTLSVGQDFVNRRCGTFVKQ